MPVRKVLRRRSLRASATRRQEWLDERENERGIPPSDVSFRWHGFWLAETYLPSHARALDQGLSTFDKGGSGLFMGSVDLDEIRATRNQRGSWQRLGDYGPDGFFAGSRGNLGLPERFERACPSLYQVAPGVSTIVTMFHLAEEERCELELIARRKYKARVEPIPHRSGETVIPPNLQRGRAIRSYQEKVRQEASRWLSSIAPGLYAGLDLPQPAWDLTVSIGGQLFRTDGEQSSSWRSTLGLERSFGRWISDQYPGLFLLGSFTPDGNGLQPTFCGIESELESLDPNGTNDLDGFTYSLNDDLSDLINLWTLRRSLEVCQDQFARISDDLAKPARPFKTRSHLNRLKNEVLPLSYDLGALSASAKERTLAILPGRNNDFRPDPSSHHSQFMPDEGLSSETHKQIIALGVEVASDGERASTGLRAQGEFLLASTNLRLQRLVAFMTLTIGVASILVAVLN